MIVNHASTLSVDYFISYLELIMNARHFSLEEAMSFMRVHFFKGEAHLYGEVTAKHFEQAIQLLEKREF